MTLSFNHILARVKTNLQAKNKGRRYIDPISSKSAERDQWKLLVSLHWKCFITENPDFAKTQLLYRLFNIDKLDLFGKLLTSSTGVAMSRQEEGQTRPMSYNGMLTEKIIFKIQIRLAYIGNVYLSSVSTTEGRQSEGMQF